MLGVMIYMSHPFLFNERFTDYDEKKKKKMWEWRSSFVNAFSFPLFGQELQGNEFDWNAQCIIHETQKSCLFSESVQGVKSYLKILLSMISCCVKLESKQSSPLKKEELENLKSSLGKSEEKHKRLMNLGQSTTKGWQSSFWTRSGKCISETCTTSKLKMFLLKKNFYMQNLTARCQVS